MLVSLPSGVLLGQFRARFPASRISKVFLSTAVKLTSSRFHVALYHSRGVKILKSRPSDLFSPKRSQFSQFILLVFLSAPSFAFVILFFARALVCTHKTSNANSTEPNHKRNTPSFLLICTVNNKTLCPCVHDSLFVVRTLNYSEIPVFGPLS